MRWHAIGALIHERVIAPLSRHAARRWLAVLLLCLLVGALQAIVVHVAAVAQPPAPGTGHGFLIDKHIAAGLTCAKCHTATPFAIGADMATCLGCHGGTYPKLAAMTENDQPNPHASHRGEEPCGSCHHVHAASVTLCNQCHSYDMTTP